MDTTLIGVDTGADTSVRYSKPWSLEPLGFHFDDKLSFKLYNLIVKFSEHVGLKNIARSIYGELNSLEVDYGERVGWLCCLTQERDALVYHLAPELNSDFDFYLKKKFAKTFKDGWDVKPNVWCHRLVLDENKEKMKNDVYILKMEGFNWADSMARGSYLKINIILASDAQSIKDAAASLRELQKEYQKNSNTIESWGRDFLDESWCVSSWDDVILDNKIKSELVDVFNGFFSHREVYNKLNVPYRRGILLVGPPGCGKTTVAKIMVSMAKTRHIAVGSWSIDKDDDGDRLKDIFSWCDDNSPSLLIVEDLDSIYESKISRTNFLNMLDGVGAAKGVFILGTTNYPERVDPGLITRAGRFDRVFRFPIPDAANRLAMLRRLDKHGIFVDKYESKIVDMTKGLTFAHLNELYITAAMRVVIHGSVDMEYLSFIIRNMNEDKKLVGKLVWGGDSEPEHVGFSQDDDGGPSSLTSPQ